MTRPTLDELRERTGHGTWWYKRYAAEPGTGPAGKMCRDCEHMTSTDPQGRGKHPKCGKTDYTSGDATTIRVKTAACKLFEPIRETMEHS